VAVEFVFCSTSSAGGNTVLPAEADKQQ
jgi:hypothetical protein